MDVLYIVKEDHEKIKSLTDKVCGALLTSEKPQDIDVEVKSLFSDLIRETRWHLHMEETYLFPEITNIYPEAEKLIKSCLNNHIRIGKILKELEDKTIKGLKKSPSISAIISNMTTSFKKEITEHFKFEEEMLLPKIRQLIPTQEREDLGQVFHDVKEELEMQATVATTTSLTAGIEKVKRSPASKRS